MFGSSVKKIFFFCSAALERKITTRISRQKPAVQKQLNTANIRLVNNQIIIFQEDW